MSYDFEDIETWIKRWRDARPHDQSADNWEFAQWDVLDDLLEDLRLHWATGTPLTEEGGYATR